MDDSEDKVYKYKLFKDNPPTICSRIGSCLYTYTIGSCLYFTNADAPDQKANMKIIELKSMTSTDKKNSKSVLEEDNNVDNEWKKKTARKAADCKMKKRIQHHFKDHVKRWLDSHRRRFPWKLILHLLLVAVVTTQVTCWKWLIGVSVHVFISVESDSSWFSWLDTESDIESMQCAVVNATAPYSLALIYF